MHGRTRKLQPRLAARVAVVLTFAAAGLAATATPSYAADTGTLNRTHGPSGGGYSIDLTADTAADVTGATGPFTAQFNVDATCPAMAPAAALGLTGGVVTTGVVEVTGIAKPGSGATVSIPVPAGMTLPAGTTAPKTFSVCLYDEGGANALKVGAEADFTLTANASPNVSSGASGGGYPITVTSTSAPFDDFNSAGHIVQFQAKVGSATGCAATAPGASAPTASNSTTMTGGVITVPTANVLVPTASTMTITVPPTLTQPATTPPMVTADYFICVYNAAGTSLLAQNGSLFNLSGNVALSTNSGPHTGGNVVSITAGAPIFTAGQTAVVVQTASCAATYTTAAAGKVDVPNVRFISKSKLAATMPSSGLPTTTTPHNLCVYAGTSDGVSALVARAFGQYTVGQVPTIASVSPSNGPAQGGTRITVTGTLFPTTPGALTATLDGVPLIDVQVQGATTFTAITPPHAPGGPYAIAVTTVLGTQTTTGLFTYTNGIVVAPQTASNTAMTPTDLDINGVGFSALKFGTTYSTNSTNAHVYLVRGVYNAGTVTTPTAVKPNPQVTECIDVLVISDTNLICSLYLGGNLNAEPTATTRTVSACASTDANGTPGANSLYIGPATATTTTCNFTQADVGMKITAGLAGAAIADNTTHIVSVSASGIARLSKQPTSALTGTTTPISLSSLRTTTDGAISNGATTLSSTLSPLSPADAGKMVTGTGIPLGTYIVSVNAGTGVATLSNAATATAANGAFRIFVPAPVPEGTYTVTVVSNGAPGASLSTTIPYTQSIISSGSTFTVAPY